MKTIMADTYRVDQSGWIISNETGEAVAASGSILVVLFDEKFCFEKIGNDYELTTWALRNNNKNRKLLRFIATSKSIEKINTLINFGIIDLYTLPGFVEIVEIHKET